MIAQELSDDIGSASLGGDLGYTDGSVFPDAMEDAIDALAIGQVSDAVETDAGTHFILLKQRTAAAQVSDEVLRAEIEDNLRSAQSQRDSFAVDKLRDAVFTADDLVSAAADLGVLSLDQRRFLAMRVRVFLTRSLCVRRPLRMMCSSRITTVTSSN